MTKELTYEQYKQLVEEQAQGLLNFLAFAASGDLNQEIEVPEGIDVFTDLAIGLSYLIDDLRVLVERERQAQVVLEQRVAERTRDLENALAEVRAVQRRYVEREWSAYAADAVIGDALFPETWAPMVETAVLQQQTTLHSNGETALAVPVRYADEVIGLMGFGSDTDEVNWDESDFTAVETIMEQVGFALENQRLFDQTQAALAEAGEQAERLTLLNQIAQVISQTLDRGEMLDAVYQQIKLVLEIDTFHIGLYDAANNTIHYPVLYEGGERQVGTTLPLYPESNSYKVIQTGEALLRHLAEEEVTQLKAKTPHILFGETDDVTASLLFAPLRVGERMLGIISVQSYKFNTYGQEDLQLLTGIAGYIAVALENASLFARTRQRAATLQTLAEIETALSLAETEDEILGAIINHIPHENVATASLSYFHTANETALDGDTPLSLVSLWTFGAFMPELINQYHSIRLDQFATTELWQENAYAPTLVMDILADNRVTPRIIEEANRLGGWRSIVQMPLRSGGLWQGIITFNWLEPQEFSEDDEFLFNRLMEPVAAVIASRRAQLAQQEALTETEGLYTAGAELNAAQTFDDVLAVIRRHTVAGQNAQIVSLNYFDRPWTEQELPEWIEVVANYNELPADTVLSRYPLAAFPSAQTMLRPDAATAVDDIATTPNLDEMSRALYTQHFGAKSTIFVPLVVGGRWVGYINAIYQQATQFSEKDVRRLMALAGQSAVAIQNIRQLQQTARKAEREQMLREIAARVRSSADVDTIMKTAVQEIGQALGRRTFIYLGNEPDPNTPSPSKTKDGA
ncbi:MAG: GAF domain-containing protein [Chloroflexi bacterium]|nr:GAF domain-containing protein [Chloroflexota bacterium]